MLLDSAHAWHRVVQAGRERAGASPVPFAAFDATFGQGVVADRDQFFPDWSVEAVHAFYDEQYPRELEALRLMAGAEALLDALAKRRLVRAVVTNTERGLAERTLAQTGLTHRVEVLSAAGDAPEKPAPDLILLALERLGLAKRQAVYVGDSESDRQAAQAAGVFMVGYRRPGDARIEKLGDLLSVLSSR